MGTGQAGQAIGAQSERTSPLVECHCPNKTGRVGARERWAEHLRAWQRSGLKQSAYCRQAGLRPTDFSQWKKKLGMYESEATGFVTLRLDRQTAEPEQRAALAIELPSGYRIAVSPHFDELTLQRLVAALR